MLFSRWQSLVVLLFLCTGLIMAAPARHPGFDQITALAVSPDSKTIVTATRDGAVRLWSVPTFAAAGRLAGKHPDVFGVAFSRDGKRLAVGGPRIGLWDLGTSTEVTSYPSSEVTSIAVSADGSHVVYGSYNQQSGWVDLVHKKLGATFQGNAVTLSHNGHLAASGGTGGRTHIYDLRSGHELVTLQTAADRVVNAVAFSPDDKILAVGDGEHLVTLWNTADGKKFRTLTGHDAVVTSVSWSPDGKRLVSAALERDLRLWDVASGKLVRRMKGHKMAVSNVCYAADGHFIISGGWDGTLALWDSSGKPVRSMRLPWAE